VTAKRSCGRPFREDEQAPEREGDGGYSKGEAPRRNVRTDDRRLAQFPRARVCIMRWWWLLLLSTSCLEPRACSADVDCPFSSVCEVRGNSTDGVCREINDGGAR
jgi:hypothetical protein